MATMTMGQFSQFLRDTADTIVQIAEAEKALADNRRKAKEAAEEAERIVKQAKTTEARAKELLASAEKQVAQCEAACKEKLQQADDKYARLVSEASKKAESVMRQTEVAKLEYQELQRRIAAANAELSSITDSLVQSRKQVKALLQTAGV
jgi:chromosome segregation ATPase